MIVIRGKEYEIPQEVENYILELEKTIEGFSSFGEWESLEEDEPI